MTDRVVEELVGRVLALADGLDRLDARELATVLQDAEVVHRAAAAVQAAVVAHADPVDAFRKDGHVSVCGWVGATVNGPRRRATDLTRVAAVCAAHPVVFERLAAGRISVEAAGELGRLHANARVRDQLGDVIEAFTPVAELGVWDQFIARVRTWEELTDADGAHHDHGHAHTARSATVTTLGESEFLDLRVGVSDGKAIREVLDHFADAEFDADWDEVVATYGDDACPALLPRTDAQRRADAVVAIFRRAASADPAARDPEPIVNYVVSDEVYDEALVALMAGRQPSFDHVDPARRWCATTDGTPVDPTDVVIASLLGHIRRVVVNGEGRVIDLGRKRRLFTGAAKEAVILQAALDHLGRRCLWPGCGRLRTQIDHATEWHQLGRTHPDNGALLCGRHNRFKTRGYRTWRDATGHWHTARPDGTEIIAA